MSRFLLLLLLTCWLLPGPRLAAAESSSEGAFVLKAAPFKASDYVAVRMQRATGQAWLVKNGNWQPIADAEPQPQGTYVLEVVSSGHADQSNWQAFRINVDTGRTWRLVSGKWQLLQVLSAE